MSAGSSATAGVEAAAAVELMAAPVTPGGQAPSAGGLPRCRTGQLSSAFTGLNFASGGAARMTLILTNHGTEVVASKCDRDTSQQWTAYSDGTLRIYGKFLDVTGHSTAVGAIVELGTCDADPFQRWQIGQTSLNPFGGIVTRGSGNVLSDPDGSTVDGTQLLMGPDRGDLSGPWHVSFYHYLGH
jgi:Ricin-type beta-trefoil lectin domain